jgi:hypothetical protein
MMSLYDQSGHLLHQKRAIDRQGINLISRDLDNYAAGVYYIIFENRDLQNLKIKG